MTALSPSHGSRAAFYLGTSGALNTPVAITQYLDNIGVPWARDKAEVSAFQNTNKAYVAGLIDAAIPFGGPWDANVDAQLYGLLTVATGYVTWQYGPTGIGSGLGILYSGTGIITKFEVKGAINAANTFAAELQCSGAPARTVQ